MKHLLLIIALFISFMSVTGEDVAGYQKLRGTVIATDADDEYTHHRFNAFDTNVATGFMARDVNGWVGLDLGDSYIIRKARVFPMRDRYNKIEGTQFQGANNPDFEDAVTFFTVTENPVRDQYVTYDFSIRQKYRYVRCINPDHRCSVAELEFYTDLGAQVVEFPQLTNLPTVYLETQGAFDFINKKDYVPSTVIVADKALVSVYPAQVRGRGNSTWEFMEKKPIRIKFNKKQNFLGMPANAKSWTLIANAVDKTLLRNGLAFEMSESFGFEFTPSHVMVDVLLDGFYYGAFMASDQLQISENRIEIDDINEMEESEVNEDNITGGYHLEIDAYADQEPIYFRTPRGMPFTLKSPDEGTAVPLQKAWIENHIAQTENLLFQNTEEALERYIDIETAVKYYLHSELTGNCDAYWCIHCYKKRGDDKLYFGPVWDFDQAFLTNERVPRYTETLSTNHGVAQPWFRKIMQTEKAQTALKQLWQELKDGDLKQRLLDFMDDNSALLQQSQELNFQRWNSLNRKVWFEGALFNTYDEYIDFVKQFIEDRFTWFDDIVQVRKAILPESSPGNPLQEWKYTIDSVASNWYDTNFNDSEWLTGIAPFGTEQKLQNTDWTTEQIHIRTKFFVTNEDVIHLRKASFRVFHDEDCKIYLNGELALERSGYISDYQFFDFDPNLLNIGWNTLAVSCTQTVGGQLIDVGVYITPEDVINAIEAELFVDKYTWYVRNDILYIDQITAGSSVSLYSIEGKLLKQQVAVGNELQITLPSHGIYLVRIEGKTIKIAY